VSDFLVNYVVNLRKGCSRGGIYEFVKNLFGQPSMCGVFTLQPIPANFIRSEHAEKKRVLRGQEQPAISRRWLGLKLACHDCFFYFTLSRPNKQTHQYLKLTPILF
jgi:hypothetical protein